MYKIRLLLISSILLILSGCWNYSEINEKIIVSGVAVDYNSSNNNIILTIEAVQPVLKGVETEISSEILQTEGETFFDAVRNFISISGRKLFWSHAKVVVISKEIANNESLFMSTLDFLSRDAETRDDIWLYISNEDTAMQIYTSDISVQKVTSFHIDDMMKNSASYSKFKSMPMYEFLDNLAIPGISATLPTIDVEEYEAQKLSRVYGTSVFKGNKMVGWLAGEDSKIFLMIINELEGGVITVNEEIDNEIVPISLEVFSNKTKIKPEYINGNFMINIETVTEANINDIGTEEDYINDENLEKLKSNGEKLIQYKIHKLIEKVQDQYKTDIFGFGLYVEREMPERWKDVKLIWNNKFTQININVKSELNIRGSATKSKTIKIGD